jgi:hypothetical protein
MAEPDFEFRIGKSDNGFTIPRNGNILRRLNRKKYKVLCDNPGEKCYDELFPCIPQGNHSPADGTICKRAVLPYYCLESRLMVEGVEQWVAFCQPNGSLPTWEDCGVWNTTSNVCVLGDPYTFIP